MANKQRLLPRREQISCHTTHKDDVGRTDADDLVGDRDVAAAGVVHFGRLPWKRLPHPRPYAKAPPRPGEISGRHEVNGVNGAFRPVALRNANTRSKASPATAAKKLYWSTAKAAAAAGPCVPATSNAAANPATRPATTMNGSPNPATARSRRTPMPAVSGAPSRPAVDTINHAVARNGTAPISITGTSPRMPQNGALRTSIQSRT
jgi:hypothetical protein